MVCDAMQFGGQVLTYQRNLLTASPGKKMCFPIVNIQATGHSEYFVHIYQSTGSHIQ
jgi:hypothetical protein